MAWESQFVNFQIFKGLTPNFPMVLFATSYGGQHFRSSKENVGAVAVAVDGDDFYCFSMSVETSSARTSRVQYFLMRASRERLSHLSTIFLAVPRSEGL